MKTNLKALSEKKIKELVKNLGEKPYRAGQIINWIYRKHAAAPDDMTDLSKPFRDRIKKIAFISGLKPLKKQVSKDGTQKFLFELHDGKAIESVLIPAGTDIHPDKNRLTLCISSQVGCAMGCKFCTTGRMGLRRNLKAYEIVDQILTVQRLIDSGQKITNIVFMGMGEPLHNFTEVIEALRRITGLLGFSRRKVTLSTAGITPRISELAKKAPRVNLAISLNATTDSTRNKIMPVNKKYPLRGLLNACKKFPLEPRRRITFEYVLLNGINDSKENAQELVKLLRGIKSKVNLIPLNITSSQKNGFRPPPEGRIIAFQKILLDAGITAMIRKSMGKDISAACGQLGTSYLPSSSETLFKSW